MKHIISIYSKSMMDSSILDDLDEDDLIIIAAILHKNKNAQNAEQKGSRNSEETQNKKVAIFLVIIHHYQQNTCKIRMFCHVTRSSAVIGWQEKSRKPRSFFNFLNSFANVWSQTKLRWVIFAHLKLWIAVARHNFKWVKIRYLIGKTVNIQVSILWWHILSTVAIFYA